MTAQSRAEQALAEYRRRLLPLLGDVLDALILYGSRARGDAAEDSDIDILVLVKGPFDYAALLQRTSQATAEVSLEYDVVLSRTFLTREDYERRRTPFVMNVHRDGVWL